MHTIDKTHLAFIENNNIIFCVINVPTRQKLQSTTQIKTIKSYDITIVPKYGTFGFY